MVRLSITFSQEQAERLEALARGFADRAATTIVPLREIARLWTQDQSEQFAGHGPYGSWAPLSEGTRASKERRGSPSEALVDTGALGASVAKRGAKGNLTRVTNDFFTGGTRNSAAHLHAFGTGERVQRSTGRRTGSLPARPFARWRPEMTERAVVVLETYLTTGSVTTEALGGLADLGAAPNGSGGLVDLDSL